MRGQERGKFFASQVRIGDKRGRKREEGGREGRNIYYGRWESGAAWANNLLIDANIVNIHVGRECAIVDIEPRPIPTDSKVENEEKGVLEFTSSVDSVGDVWREEIGVRERERAEGELTDDVILTTINKPSNRCGGPLNGIRVPVAHTGPGLAPIGSVVTVVVRPVDSAIANIVSIHSFHDINLAAGWPSLPADGITQHPRANRARGR
jgi:hypothetical protein